MPEPLEIARVNTAWPTIEKAVLHGLSEKDHPLSDFVRFRDDPSDELHVTFTPSAPPPSPTVTGGTVVVTDYAASTGTFELTHRLRLALDELGDADKTRVTDWAAAARSEERSEVIRRINQASESDGVAMLPLAVEAVRSTVSTFAGVGDPRLLVFSTAEPPALAQHLAGEVEVAQADTSDRPAHDVGALLMWTGSGPTVIRSQDLQLEWSLRNDQAIDLVLTERLRIDWPATPALTVRRFGPPPPAPPIVDGTGPFDAVVTILPVATGNFDG